MLKFFKAFILMFCLQAFLAQSGKGCEKWRSVLERFCSFSDSDFKNFSFSYEGTNCTNSTHVAVYFSYNISSDLQPEGIKVVLYGNDGNMKISSRQFRTTLSYDNGALFIAKKSWQNKVDLTLQFAILHSKCKDTRFSNPDFTFPVADCSLGNMFSCPDLPTSTNSFTDSIVVKLKTETPINSILNATARAADKNEHVTVAVASAFAALAVFSLAGLVALRFVSKRNRRIFRYTDQRDLAKNNSSATVAFPAANAQTFYPVKLFLIFVPDHQRHLNVIKSFASFLQGDLSFEVSCEIFQTLEYSQDPVAWMDKCLNDADKVLVIWSHNAVSRWMQYSKEEFDYLDLFTPVLKHIYKDLFRHRNREKYYFGFFDCFAKENIPREFINETNFRLMDEFEDLYYRLKSIEPYVPGGEIKEERVMYNHYNSSQYGTELHKAIQEINLLAQNNPDWYVQSVGASFSEPNPNVQLEINCNILNIQPPTPIVIDQKVFKKNVSTTNHVLNNSMNEDLLILDSLAKPPDSSRQHSLIKNENFALQTEEQVLDQHVNMININMADELTSTGLDQHQHQKFCYQPTSSIPKYKTFVQVLPKQPSSLDSGIDNSDVAMLSSNLILEKSRTEIKPILAPIDLQIDPMSSLVAVNENSKSNNIN